MNDLYIFKSFMYVRFRIHVTVAAASTVPLDLGCDKTDIEALGGMSKETSTAQALYYTNHNIRVGP
jgi:hypothetical protein